MGVKTSEHRLISHVGFGSRLQVELEDDMTIRWTSSSVSVEKVSNFVSGYR